MIEEENSISDRLEPAGFLNGVIGAEEAETETVNDVASDKYTFDERAFGQPDIAKSTGEMWGASDGGNIVKQVLTTEGNANYFGEEMEGTLSWNYELTDVYQPVTITLPENCPAGMVDDPLLPDASNTLNMPSLLAYDAASSVTNADFHQEQIPALGWMLVDVPTLAETNALMEFTQGNRMMTVIITPADPGTKVQIGLAKAQEEGKYNIKYRRRAHHQIGCQVRFPDLSEHNCKLRRSADGPVRGKPANAPPCRFFLRLSSHL